MTWKFRQSPLRLTELEFYHRWRYLSFLLLGFQIESCRIILLRGLIFQVEPTLIHDFLLHFLTKIYWKWFYSWFGCNRGQLPLVKSCITFTLFSLSWPRLKVFSFVPGRVQEGQHWSMACCQCKIHIEWCYPRRFFAQTHYWLYRHIFLDLRHQNRNKFSWFCLPHESFSK